MIKTLNVIIKAQALGSTGEGDNLAVHSKNNPQTNPTHKQTWLLKNQIQLLACKV